MDERQRRIGANEAVFRRVNENLVDLNETFAAVTDRVSLVCECGQVDCTEQIEMSLDEYERLRQDAQLFAIVPGHEAADVEEVVAEHGGYSVVRKRPGPWRRLAEASDPR